MARHLAEVPAVEGRWLDKPGLKDAEEAVVQGKLTQEKFEAAEAIFRSRYPRRGAADFDPQISERLQATLRTFDGLIGRSDTWDETLVPSIEPLHAFVSGFKELVSRIVERAADAGSALGQSTSGLNLAGLERIAELAELAFQATKRPGPWWPFPRGPRQLQPR